MPEYIFSDENEIYQIDLSKAIWAIGNLHKKYESIGNFLSDADFIAETDNEVLIIEYKNAEIENKKNPKAFNEKVTTGKLYDNILKKYYGSVFYLLACKKYKKISFIFIIECEKADKVLRNKIRTSIQKRLPYQLQEMDGIQVNLISNFEVLSIKEWNEHSKYSKFPLTKIS